ncbi:MAG TPA: hypothetical protein VGS12_18740 [Caulobacteraceae bacterium]|nr:hypothetical protein [Caulobacteraceae bacterium]
MALALATGPGVLAQAAPVAPAGAGSVDPGFLQALRWREVGPFRGGRSDAVVGVPSEPDVFYFGAAAGGVWKSLDAGGRWTEIFEGGPTGSIGAIAVAPSDPDVIWVGTGENALRGDITWGDGVYRSLDGGRTWTHLGLADTRQIGAILVDPTNPDIALVAAIGHAFGPNAERGVYRTADGGRTWTKVLYRDENTGAIDLAYDPQNPRIVWAALWQMRRLPWNMSSGGPGSGLYRSADGGLTWTRLEGHGLPAGILGRIDIAPSPARPGRIWAMIEAKAGGLYRSDDGGATWTLINQDGRLTQRAWYFSKIYADPKSPDTVYALNTGLLRSTDGGRSFQLVAATHGDHHALWIDPNDPRRMINGNDGGASVTLDGGITWSTQENQPTAAIYHVAADDQFPYRLYGAQQDNSNLAIATYDDNGVIGRWDWFPAGGGESGFVLPDPRDPEIIYSTSENNVSRFDHPAEQSQDISPEPEDYSGHPASELAHRFNWTSPLLISPHDPGTLFWGADVVWKSTDEGASWRIISPDLTRDDKSKQGPSGGPLTKDITSVEYYDTVFSMAESPIKPGLLWVGSDDGLVHVSPDGGGHWDDVTPKDLPAWSAVSMIEPSHFDPQVAYIAVDRHKLDDVAPYAWRTADGGKTWISIAHGLPEGAVVHAVREDPQRRGLLYAATETGVFVSFDDGGDWQSLQLNLARSPVHDLIVKGDDLAVATHGRGFWILDDVTPLRQLGGADSQAMRLFAPETAVRLYYPDEVNTRRPVGADPPFGAIVDYAFRTAPAGEVDLDILDAQGRLVRHLSNLAEHRFVQPPEWPNRIEPTDTIPARAGLNRFVWDLRMNGPVQIPGAFYSGEEPRGPIVAPGRYTVRLSWAGQTRTAPLIVIADPRVKGSEAAIVAKTHLAIAVEADIDALHLAVNAIRAARASLEAIGAVPRAQALEARLDLLEQTLMQVNMKGSEANLAFPGELNERYASLAEDLEDADRPPTQAQQALYDDMHAGLTRTLAAWRRLQDQELQPFLLQHNAAPRS